MASTEEFNGLIKGLDDIIQTQQKTNADACKQMTEQLQNLLSTVEALSKSITPQAVSSLSHANAAPGLCLPHITLPVFTGKENLDRFIEQITSLLQSFGVVPKYWTTYLKQQVHRDAQAYDSLIEAEKEHQHLLSSTPKKHHQMNTKNILRHALTFKKNVGNREINKSGIFSTSIIPWSKPPKNLLQNLQIVLCKHSVNWRN